MLYNHLPSLTDRASASEKKSCRYMKLKAELDVTAVVSYMKL